jgi:hypothetical protein
MSKIKKLIAIVSLISILAIFIFPSPVLAIQNGTPDDESHPYVVICVFDVDVGGKPTPVWRTTGFLISPTVVVTAGHGTYGTVGARVSNATYIPPIENPPNTDEYPFPGDWAIEAAEIHTYPDYLATPTIPGLPMFDAYDVGIIILSEPIILNEYAQLPDAGFVDTLRKYAPVDIVGYGVTSQERGNGVDPYNAWQWDRYRNFATANLIPSKGVISDMFLTVSSNKGKGTGGTTFGDSGGPILNAGTNIVLGLNSFVPNVNCDGVGYDQRIDREDILEWINYIISIP